MCCRSSSQTDAIEAIATPGESRSKKRRSSKGSTCPAKGGPTMYCESQHRRRRSIAIAATHLRWTSICSTVVRSPSSTTLIIAASRAPRLPAQRRPSHPQHKGYRRRRRQRSRRRRAHRAHFLIMPRPLHPQNPTSHLEPRHLYLKVTILINFACALN